MGSFIGARGFEPLEATPRSRYGWAEYLQTATFSASASVRDRPHLTVGLSPDCHPGREGAAVSRGLGPVVRARQDVSHAKPRRHEALARRVARRNVGARFRPARGRIEPSPLGSVPAFVGAARGRHMGRYDHEDHPSGRGRDRARRVGARICRDWGRHCKRPGAPDPACPPGPAQGARDLVAQRACATMGGRRARARLAATREPRREREPLRLLHERPTDGAATAVDGREDQERARQEHLPDLQERPFRPRPRLRLWQALPVPGARGRLELLPHARQPRRRRCAQGDAARRHRRRLLRRLVVEPVRGSPAA